MIEQKVADTLLQKPCLVKAGDKEYTVARPTLATLIEVSRYISQLPISDKIGKDGIIPFVLANAKDSGPVLANIAAVLIIGAKNMEKVPEKRNKWHFPWFKKKTKESEVEKLSRELINNASCQEISAIIIAALSYHSIGFFLTTIISLSGANVSEETKSETEATARGE